ncbi:MAG: M48 family metallopeptidase [Maledivibacter sp.]|jgi:predicted metal-dependent hydrolase|nr:M48 family metallopeptidase [Maledivibacter sp.]
MDSISIVLSENVKINVSVYHKNVKNVRLKVFPDGKVSISVPLNVSDKWIVSFLNQKSKWINEKLKEYQKTAGVENIFDLKSGMSVKFFGIDTIVVIKKAAQKKVYYDNDKIYIETLNLDKQHIIKEQFDKFIRDALIEKINKKVDKLYSIIKKYDYEKPSISIRKMKTMWGSCLPEKSKITVNFYLYQAPSICIEYVLLHELIHFIHPNHSKEFYNLLSLYMPDWKKRKNKLDYEVIMRVK